MSEQVHNCKCGYTTCICLPVKYGKLRSVNGVIVDRYTCKEVSLKTTTKPIPEREPDTVYKSSETPPPIVGESQQTPLPLPRPVAWDDCRLGAILEDQGMRYEVVGRYKDVDDGEQITFEGLDLNGMRKTFGREVEAIWAALKVQLVKESPYPKPKDSR